MGRRRNLRWLVVALFLVACGGSSTASAPTDGDDVTEAALSPANEGSTLQVLPPQTTTAVPLTTAPSEPLRSGDVDRLVDEGELVIATVFGGPDGDLVRLLDETGNILHDIDVEGAVWVQQVVYPERLIAVVTRDNEIERFVIDSATGAAESLGVSESIQGWGFRGQPRAGSRWYVFTNLRIDGAQELVDLETMTVRQIPYVGGIDTIEMSATDDLLAVQESRSSLRILDTMTFEERQRVETQTQGISMNRFSPNGAHLLVTEFLAGPDGSVERSDLVPRVSVVDVDSGLSRSLLDGAFARGWLSATEVLVETSDNEQLLVVSSESGETVSVTQPGTLFPQVGASTAPWHVAELESELVLVERRTGETRVVELRSAMSPIVGVGRVPDQRFVWANAGGPAGASNELGALVVDTVTGQAHEFSASNEGGFIGSASLALSSDASQAVAASAGSSFLMAADGTVRALPAAQIASFCGDGRFVLVVGTSESSDVLLFDAGVLEDPTAVGPASTAICTGG